MAGTLRSGWAPTTRPPRPLDGTDVAVVPGVVLVAGFAIAVLLFVVACLL